MCSPYGPFNRQNARFRPACCLLLISPRAIKPYSPSVTFFALPLDFSFTVRFRILYFLSLPRTFRPPPNINVRETPRRPSATMAASTSDTSELSALFHDFIAPVNSIALNVLRAVYDQLIAKCDQPDKLRAIVQDVVQARLQLDLYKIGLNNERNRNMELESKLDEKTREISDMETSLALEQEKTKAANDKVENLEKEKKVIKLAYQEQVKAMQL